MLPDGYKFTLDKNYTAKIKYDANNAIDLNDFTDALSSIAKMYQDFAQSELPKSVISDLGVPQIYLQGVNKGSIELFLAIQNIPYITTFSKHLLELFIDKILSLFKRILNKDELEAITKSELIGTVKITNPIAMDSAQQFNIGIVNNEIYNSIIVLNYTDAHQIQINAKEELTRREEKYEETINKAAFKWSVADFDKKGDKAIIYKICNKPVKVVFTNNTFKDKMHNYTSWHKQIFIVDAEITWKDEEPILYKVLNVYFDDTYPDPQ